MNDHLEDEIENTNQDDGIKSAGEVAAGMTEFFQRRATWPVIEPGDSYITKLKKVQRYYEIEMPFLMAHHEERSYLYRAYPYDWAIMQTPIEQMAWEAIRRIGHVALYPQFPVGRYHLDFGAPHLKIGVELDGKAYHDASKDLERDRELKKLGWKIYRITGREMNRADSPYDMEFDSAQQAMEALRDFFANSGEGVLYAIRMKHFGQDVALPGIRYEELESDMIDQLCEQIRQMCEETLREHTSFDRI